MTAPAGEVMHALSFDIEDWFHVTGVSEFEDPAGWSSLPTLVEARTDEILAICAEARVRATFFIVGWIADRHPDLVRRIVESGHELGSHSNLHRLVFEQDREGFAEDLRRSIGAIGDAAGVAPVGFRAPCFSIVPGFEWAFDELIDSGLQYDASLFPVRRENGGYPCPDRPHVFTATPSGRGMPVLPMSLARILGVRTGFSGGSYFRLLPPRVLLRLFEARTRRGLPAVVYLHPRDFAPDCPVAPLSPWRRLYLHAGLSRTADKLRMLLERFRFGTCGEVLAAHLDVPGGSPGTS